MDVHPQEFRRRTKIDFQDSLPQWQDLTNLVVPVFTFLTERLELLAIRLTGWLNLTLVDAAFIYVSNI